MPIRRVKQHTDRGSIKDLARTKESAEETVQPYPSELRMKKLFEYSKLHKDEKMLSVLGFITTDYISDKNALPLSVYRLRQMVGDISSKPNSQVSQIKTQLDQCFDKLMSAEASAYLEHRKIKKVASIRRPAFWRVE